MEKGHRPFLQTGLEILGLGPAHADLVQQPPKDAEHDLPGRDIAAVFVHGGQHGFEHIAEHGVTAAAALLFLAAPQTQQLVDARFPGPLGQAGGAHQLGAHTGHVAFAGLREAREQLPRDAQFKDGIAQELQTLVMRLPQAVFIGPRAVGQGQGHPFRA